ncbi:MAG TPA: alpha/beta hydrolase-fold protein [Thermoleophilia bacterium]|nr:alpha/beta hydrolase-fold protein [Thermoleophilia bacterium]
MAVVDGTRELMRHDLEVWPGDRGAGRCGEAGMTRRGLLAAAGLGAAALVAGGVAWRVAPWRDWLGAAGDAVGVDIPGTPHVIRRDFTLHSRYVGGPVPYSIAWPPGSEPGDPLPVCFALPGRGGGPPMGFADFVAAAVRKDQSPPYAVVGVDGGQSYWHRRKTGEDRLSMLLRELVPLCARTYRLGGGRGRAVIGWSMGGYGAVLAAETEPRLFAAVVAVGPAVWTSYDAMMLGPRDAFDDAADFAEHDVIARADRLEGVDLRIDCGRKDPFYCYVTSLAAALPDPGSVHYGSGGHDYDFFHKVAPADARFIGRALRRRA